MAGHKPSQWLSRRAGIPARSNVRTPGACEFADALESSNLLRTRMSALRPSSRPRPRAHCRGIKSLKLNGKSLPGNLVPLSELREAALIEAVLEG